MLILWKFRSGQPTLRKVQLLYPNQYLRTIKPRDDWGDERTCRDRLFLRNKNFATNEGAKAMSDQLTRRKFIGGMGGAGTVARGAAGGPLSHGAPAGNKLPKPSNTRRENVGWVMIEKRILDHVLGGLPE